MNALKERLRGVWARLTGARAYRYDGEQDAHEDQLRETQAALGIMAGAPPDQAVMASDIEHGVEDRLGVLLGKARLSLAEKRERDAIQAGLQARRQGFDAPAQETPRSRPFAAVGAANPILGTVMGLLGNPTTWMIAGLALLGSCSTIQTWRLNHAKDDLKEAREISRQNYDAAERWRERSEHYRQGLIDAANVARQAASALTSEREAHARAAARERRRQRDIQNVLVGAPEPPPWRLRDDDAVGETGRSPEP